MSPGRLAAWISRVPKTASRLELRHDSIAGQCCIAGYIRSDVQSAQQPAEELCEVAQEHCDAMRARVTMTCVWLDENDRVLSSQPIRCTPENDNGDDIDPKLAGAGDPPKEAATIDGIVAQLMRHVENRERMLNIALGTNLKLMHDQLREARTEADSLRSELRIARKRVKDVEAGSEENVESEARAEAVHKVTEAIVTQLIPLAAARLRGELNS